MARLSLFAVLSLIGCSPGVLDLRDPEPEPEPDVVYDYDIDRVLDVRITLDDSDWDELRNQSRSFYEVITGEDCLSQPFPSPYSWFASRVEIDGVVVDDVAVRKKGFIGSVTPTRPSLKLKFDRIIDGQRWEGIERLTLNNGRQDPSRIKQCLGYSMFDDAGLPASRCSFARVEVNGEDLGVYANVEPVKSDMLERHFGNGDGNLYEGTLSDFREGWMGTFDDKTEVSDRSDLQALADVLQLPDSELEAALEEVIDVDQFLSFWSMEVAIGHRDGYAGNRNNYFVYADPSDGRFRFIPWGIDGIFNGGSPFGENQPVGFVARSMLPVRAIRHPGLQERYKRAMERTLDTVWDEDALQARLDRMLDLTEPYAWPFGGDEGRYDESVFNTERFIAGRRGEIETELRDGWRPPLGQLDPDTPCLVERGAIDISFDTTWNSARWSTPWDTGEGSFDLSYDGSDAGIEFLGATVGDTDGGRVLLVSGQFPNGTGVLLWGRATNDELFTTAGVFGADWTDMETYLLIAQGGGHNDYQVVAYTGGPLTLDQSDVEPGAPVRGALDLVIWGGAR